MNNLSFDDPSLDNLDSSLSLHDPSDIDTALLNDIDGKRHHLFARAWLIDRFFKVLYCVFAV